MGKGLRLEQLITEILLVDDDSINLNLLKNILQQEGMAVQCSMSGEEALQFLSEKTFNLMITDWNMPGIGGLSLAKKAIATAPGMTIIMMTGSISPDIPRLAKEAGIATVLAKPFSSKKLLEAVRRVVR